MNCKCIENIEKKLIGMEFGNKKKKVTKAKIISVALMFGEKTLECITNSEVEIEVDGYKKPQKQTLVHSFCPFCGTKIKKES